MRAAISWFVGNLSFVPASERAFKRPGTGRIDITVASDSSVAAVTSTNRLGQPVEFLRSTPPAPGARAFARYAGRYVSDELGVTSDVRATSTGISVGIAPPHARLPFAFFFEAPLELPAVLPNWFATRSFTFRFLPDAAGSMTRLRVSHERAHNIEFVRIADTAGTR